MTRALLFLAAVGFGSVSALAETLLIADKAGDALLYFDTGEGKVVRSVAVGRNPHEVIVSRDGRLAFTANSRSNTISVVDLATGTEVERIASEEFQYPHGMAILADGATMLVTSEQNRLLLRVDLRAYDVVGSLPTEMGGSHMIVLSPTGKRAYMTNRESNTVTLLDPENNAILRHADAGAGAEGIALSPDGKWLAVANRGDDDVFLYDADSLERDADIAVGDGPVRAAFSPDGAWLVVSHRASDQVHVIDMKTRTTTARVGVGKGPGGIAFSGDGARAFVANTNGGTLSVLAVGSWKSLSTHDAGEGPDGVLVLPSRD